MAAAEKRRHARWPWLTAALAIVLCLAVAIWATDRVTLQGERVLYGVNCGNGQWRDLACTGRLEPGDRYAFRVSPRRHEVIAWTIGLASPSRTYSGCEVMTRDRWSCPLRKPDGSSATLTMSKHGVQCVPASSAPAAHVISKWKWYLLRSGVLTFSRAHAVFQMTC